MSDLPGWFIIGAQKSGTTRLYGLLAQHPSLQVSSSKEPMFFSRDEAWLHPHDFAERDVPFNWENEKIDLDKNYLGKYFPESSCGRMRGEASTSYLPSMVAPQRIYALNQDAKIIVLLRHPVYRAYSAYCMYQRDGCSTRDLEEHLRYEGGLTLRMGHYVEHLERWLGIFPRKQILVIAYEDFCKNETFIMREIEGFIGLTPFVYDPRVANNGANYPDMNPEIFLKLLAYYKIQNKNLDNLLGQDITCFWW